MSTLHICPEKKKKKIIENPSEFTTLLYKYHWLSSKFITQTQEINLGSPPPPPLSCLVTMALKFGLLLVAALLLVNATAMASGNTVSAESQKKGKAPPPAETPHHAPEKHHHHHHHHHAAPPPHHSMHAPPPHYSPPHGTVKISHAPPPHHHSEPPVSPTSTRVRGNVQRALQDPPPQEWVHERLHGLLRQGQVRPLRQILVQALGLCHPPWPKDQVPIRAQFHTHPSPYDC
ncbi:extensin-like [Rhodamnia argentea]|uniref:Extensin-like n=1 Tax=Rhodamnia argentea TaxID=178133 RepID=A0A8B8R2K3_9MYRT|nr:extensin-like [Rhodamnia argentea]